MLACYLISPTPYMQLGYGSDNTDFAIKEGLHLSYWRRLKWSQITGFLCLCCSHLIPPLEILATTHDSGDFRKSGFSVGSFVDYTWVFNV